MRYELVVLATAAAVAPFAAAFYPVLRVLPQPHHRIICTSTSSIATSVVCSTTTTTTTTTTTSQLFMSYPKQEFERAIACACEPGLCKDDELYNLANLLEAYDHCLVPDDDCEQEKVDRQDVVDILRADAALQLRLVYLKDVNIFKERVEELKNKEDKPAAVETMIRAVECASTPGLSKDSSELNQLADALEKFKGCLDEDDGDQERVDRQDVVDILRMQSSLQLRQVYLQNVNIFKERVEEAAVEATDV